MSLTATEKEQVAVLLGWERERVGDTGTMWWNPRIVGERRWQHPGHPVPDFPGITLEACMEYAKGKGCDVYGIEWQADYERHEAYVCPNRNGSAYHAEDPDPTVAFVRALLKAEEASRG